MAEIRLSEPEVKRLSRAYLSGFGSLCNAVADIAIEHEASALQRTALSVPTGPHPDPADYLRECAAVLVPVIPTTPASTPEEGS